MSLLSYNKNTLRKKLCCTALTIYNQIVKVDKNAEKSFKLTINNFKALIKIKLSLGIVSRHNLR